MVCVARECRNRKGQGLPLNIIVIAALVLIVLVVIIAIFSGRIGKFGSGLDESSSGFDNACELPGTARECMAGANLCDGRIVSGSFGDCKSKIGDAHVCCDV